MRKRPQEEKLKMTWNTKKLALLAALLFWLGLAPVHAASQPVVVGSLMGQLGNQMFQVAATVSLALDNHAQPVFPDLAQKKGEGIPLNREKVFFRLKTKLSKKRTISFVYNEPCYNYQPIPYHPDMRIKGFFQSEKYFVRHRSEILALFHPHTTIETYLQKKFGNLLRHPCTVSVHMRSYFKEDPEQHLYPFYGRAFIEKAMALFPQDSLFLVFSNDMALCKKELMGIPREVVFIEGEPYYHDLYLMSMCQHNIIGNSSFSWWAAYLNPHPEKIVVTPPKWVSEAFGLNCQDVIPEGWIVLSD